ncbi:hypothetical protein GCM10010199_58390 [Dactylosporangium roseum]
MATNSPAWAVRSTPRSASNTAVPRRYVLLTALTRTIGCSPEAPAADDGCPTDLAMLTPNVQMPRFQTVAS